jgi:hypothetical protein
MKVMTRDEKTKAKLAAAENLKEKMSKLLKDHENERREIDGALLRI